MTTATTPRVEFLDTYSDMDSVVAVFQIAGQRETAAVEMTHDSALSLADELCDSVRRNGTFEQQEELLAMLREQIEELTNANLLNAAKHA